MIAGNLLEIQTNVSHFLQVLKRTLEGPLLRGKVKVNEEDYTDALLMIEAARIRNRLLIAEKLTPSQSHWVAIKQDLLEFIEKFKNLKIISSETMAQRLIIETPFSREKLNFLFYDSPKSKKRINLMHAINEFEYYIERVEIHDDLFSEENTAYSEKLQRIVPEQKFSPVKFEIINNKIRIAHNKAEANDQDKTNVNSALEYIRDSGRHIIKNLEQSNCDPRLLDSMKVLQENLESGEDIIKAGCMNIMCGNMAAKFMSELPDATAAMLTAFNANVSLYVAQFPEWEQFTRKAAQANLDEDDVNEIDRAAAEVIDTLSSNPNLADPEVPRTIELVQKFLKYPGSSTKRAAFAMMRTIENLVSSIIQHSMDFIDKTAEKVVDKGSTTASKIVVGLLGVALLSATGIGSAAAHAGAPWVREAAQIVQKLIENSSG